MIRYYYIFFIAYFVSLAAPSDDYPTDKPSALKELNHLGSKLPYKREDYLAYSRMQIPFIVPLLQEVAELSKIVIALFEQALPILTSEKEKENCKETISDTEILNSEAIDFLVPIRDTEDLLSSLVELLLLTDAVKDLQSQQKAHEPLYWFDESARSLKNLIYYAKEQSRPNISTPGKHLAAYFLAANIDNALNELEKSICELQQLQIRVKEYINMDPVLRKKSKLRLYASVNSKRTALNSNALYPRWDRWVKIIQDEVETLEKF